MSYLMDYHVHSIHSFDAYDSISDICKSAVDGGLCEIVITDHFEPGMWDDYNFFYDKDQYLTDVKNARQDFDGKLKVKFGVELGEPHLYPEASESIMEYMPYDYVLGSIHKFIDNIDAEDIDYSRFSETEICSLYLEEIRKLVKWNNFDCVGHLDLIKRYSRETYGKNLSLTCQHELLQEVLKGIIESGKGIEINTSGLRQPPKETMPGIDVLKLYLKLGGEILTVGSDSHRAEDVGKGIAEGIELAREAGFRFITAFNCRKPEWINITNK